MPLPRDSREIVIAGASSLLGAEVKSLLEESRFADWDFRLLDEELAAGTLTETGGEPALIQPVEEDSFSGARLIFFTGSPDFVKANLPLARQSGAQIIDLSGASAGEADVQQWFPHLEALRNKKLDLQGRLYASLSVPAAAGAMLTFALAPLGLQSLSIVALQPVSEAGKLGIEELESQTSHLLSLQTIGQPVFDTQVAFNTLHHYGAGCRQKLSDVAHRVSQEMCSVLPSGGLIPMVQVIHVPVFYGCTFSAAAALHSGLEIGQIAEACRKAGFVLTAPDEPGPSNVTAAGENAIQLAQPESAPGLGDWRLAFWGAADNIRFPAWNAVKLAERLAS
jgi:aspartate-semialdehyde dehydrogenase